MKVLLAPLFFRSRFCKHCARIIYKENPGSWLGIHEFESFPPLGSFDAGRGFIPDFPALLMFDEFVLDGEAYERLKKPGDRFWLKEWAELILVLESEGVLTLRDVSAAAEAKSHKRGWMMRKDLEDPQRWWQAMAYCNALIGRASNLLGEHPKEAQSLSWEFDPSESYGIPGEDGDVHDLSVVLHEAGESDLKAHQELYLDSLAILKDQLREVNACITACNELDVAPLMWAPYRRYLDEKLSLPLSNNAMDQEQSGRQFFEISFPAYAPTSVKDFAKFRSDRRINSLRSEILRASKTGEVIDSDYPQRILMEVLSLEQKAAQVRRISGWISTAIGSIPIPGLGIASAAVAEGVSSHLEQKKREPWHWFYLISDGRGAT